VSQADPAGRSPRRAISRLGRRFLLASLGVLAIALAMIVVAAQAMFINEHDLGLLMWVLVPAVVAAAVVALLVARPVARDARRIDDAARRVAAGDLEARTGVHRGDELGDAADAFDEMVERLAAVERERTLMLSAISHDLRTPLAALRAAVEALRDGVADDPDQYLTGMERQVRALASLVDDLQLHTRISSGTLELRRSRVDLTELADEAIETLRPLAGQHDVKLLLEAEQRITITGDAAQLARVIRNLLDNAIRHAPMSSVVLVQVRGHDDGVVMRVIDQGEGFPAEFRDRAFEPFTRADPARNVRTGTAGLGLAIARGIVAAHAGSVGVVDGPGGIVEIRLPL
jgi:signal transduction histidine kinase